MRKSWFGTVAKPNKSPSLELLKSLYGVLVKNSIVVDHNRTLIVEVLRSIAETVIWGDQNEPRVFDFFLEKGIQSYFLSIIEQPKCGTYVCTQLLQTLNILFENIRNETSIYFLLSNNHVNSIICHRFDFSDEEIMAYYISFLKTLSLKLNNNTIHFFYNEHLRDFPLYTEAIKFFNHPESMVRIAVRTLTLNVYRVGDEATIKFIHDKTAAPYFSNLVWFIGNNVLMMERCLRTEANHLTRNKLESLVALHLDDVHYVHDILQLNMQSLNSMLCEHLLNTLLIPLYVYSLDPSLKVDSPVVSVKCALFLLSQVFLVLSHPPLVKQLKLYICFEENPDLGNSSTVRRFTKPRYQIQDNLKPAVIPKNKQNLQPTKLAREHREELRAREARRAQEYDRLKDLEKYQKKEKFSQTGYLKSILDPDQGTDPLLGTKVHLVDSVKTAGQVRSGTSEGRSRESSTISKASSNSERILNDGMVDLQRGSITSDLVAAPQIGNEEDEPGPVVANDYPVSEDSGIVSTHDFEDAGPSTGQQNPSDSELREASMMESESTDTLFQASESSIVDTDTFRSPKPESPTSLPEGEVVTPTSSHTFDTPVSSQPCSPKPTSLEPELNHEEALEDPINGSEQLVDVERSTKETKRLSEADMEAVSKSLTSDRTTKATTPPDPPSTGSASGDGGDESATSAADTFHFADAFHCPPTRSCIFYDALLSCLELGEDDVEGLFSACLLYAMHTNSAMPHRAPAPFCYDDRVIDRLLNILDKSCHPDGIVRLVTVEVAVRLLRVLTSYEGEVILQDNHLAVLTAVKENSVRFLRGFYTGEDNTLFVELFDEEYKDFKRRRPTNLQHLMGDECMLLGPVYTPLTGIEFTKRLPCGDLEKMRKSLIVFFTVRKLWQEALQEEEGELPLLNLSLQVTKGDVLNLNHSDLIACAVVTDNDVVKRFLVIDTHQLILVEPDNAPGRLGWGIVQFVAPLQCVDARPDKDSNRNLTVSIEKNASNNVAFKAKFQFEDHIRCFAAKTRLKQGRESLQKLKGFKLSHVLDVPDRQREEPFLGSSRPPLTVYKAGPVIGKSRAETSGPRPYSSTSGAATRHSSTLPSSTSPKLLLPSSNQSSRNQGSPQRGSSQTPSKSTRKVGSEDGKPTTPRSRTFLKHPDPEVV